jgi:hypothetical protein
MLDPVFDLRTGESGRKCEDSAIPNDSNQLTNQGTAALHRFDSDYHELILRGTLTDRDADDLEQNPNDRIFQDHSFEIYL